MGNGTSRPGGRGKDAPAKWSRLSRFRRRIRRDDSRDAVADMHLLKNLAAEDFVGISLVEIIGAEMKFKDRWLACLSLGERTYRTDISDQRFSFWYYQEKKVVLERDGPHIARISVFETNKLKRNNLVGYCEIDLLEALNLGSGNEVTVVSLIDPSSPSTVVGNLSLSCCVEDPIETEQSFARHLLALVDYNADGKLTHDEFSDLVKAFGNQAAASKKEELFKLADSNGDGVVDMDELATLLAIEQEEESLISNCPVCGESLGKYDRLNDVIHMTLCFDEGTGNQIMTGGFLTDVQASYGWMFKLSEWTHYSSYGIGLKSGSSASHILVFDRRTRRLVEEIIDEKIILSMRAIYQSKVGLKLIDKGAKELLHNLSEKQGRHMNSPESAKDIPKFIEFFKDQINVDEIKHPIDSFKTFNEFFIRELKPGARPIAHEECDDIAICAADSRLMAFTTIDDSIRFWIKGRKFSVQGLLGVELCSSAFIGGSLVIFRLAPQDYHRYHVPVSGIIEDFVDIPGSLYTVNPIAVNSKYCNVFTENKRVVSIISTSEFGKVAFVAIGATMVGSITFIRQKGDYVQKGDEFGYFSFGGSTVICVFEKDSIELDEDLTANSQRSLETLVSVGMPLGVAKRKLFPAEIPNLDKCSL
ncbi:phosphatidylserine decarboxylase [Apostasia shenzhenica]|uniref:Phosphatidylserine decarboxylase proenzyme 2 n=1 Tax=Apostasia shenzhenica TaxID=1088818 RepID=A0A2I0ANQ0_9ASPA|nr:phosphatidylserine decarboxylase [Apostasia shenzhenica]